VSFVAQAILSTYPSIVSRSASVRKALPADGLSDRERAGLRGGFHDGGCTTPYIYPDQRTENYCSPPIRSEHPWGLVQEFPFPPSQSLGFELVLSAGLCQVLHPADQLENDTRVYLQCESPPYSHRYLLLLDHYGSLIPVSKMGGTLPGTPASNT
jgi:hypothetical protein